VDEVLHAWWSALIEELEADDTHRQCRTCRAAPR
jgi:hypothetical protein